MCQFAQLTQFCSGTLQTVSYSIGTGNGTDSNVPNIDFDPNVIFVDGGKF